MKIRLFCCDLDGTVLGNPDATIRFAVNWQAGNGERPLLCYNTGRIPNDALRVIRDNKLPAPDYLIAGIGTSITDLKTNKRIKEFSDILEEGWDLSNVEDIVKRVLPEAEKQASHLQGRLKSSWYIRNFSDEQEGELNEAFKQEHLDVNVIYVDGLLLDIVPKSADKGHALEWLIKELKILPEETLVAGDGGHDASMFLIPGIQGFTVQNAQPELFEATLGQEIHVADGTFGEGVIEGLLEFGIFTDKILTSHPEVPNECLDPAILRMIKEEEDFHLPSDVDKDYLKLAYEKAVEGLRRCITPMGFNACSLSDNESRGTDENYYSVWARDGSISVIGSLCLEDEDIRECQRNTLETLLNCMAPTGQIPSNVRIKDQVPDYSGVGGIASIDSGLWVIIACYEYVLKTGDLAFLRNHRNGLQRAMDWLSAHDSNNDALLEIPEAGDWTDLFGRSYNVLYDEVLWYRANICYGRIMEFLGQRKRAGDYLRWSRQIQNAILAKFWPQTNGGIENNYSFADQQSSLGDTNYLIAQVTPFGFDWRLDIYGNILAFLFNVLDPERARIAFRFMWGVGVHEPFPVANLYPPVQAGDPEWKEYYTVNLLNLPRHYHNGGIWPFIGAQWVRFIHRLGFPDLAFQELVNLAQLNQKGFFREWEFNEWAHGETGKPMGKAYQAWSCSEFIQACHELKINNL